MGKMVSKSVVYYLLGAFVIYFMLIMWTNTNNRNEVYFLDFFRFRYELETTIPREKNSSLKYMLIWTHPPKEPLKFLGEGQGVFIRKNCSVTDCYVTTNKKFFNNVLDYDVLLFHDPQIHKVKRPDLPSNRSTHQLFVFVSMESSDYYPLCNNNFDKYFNLTWTYKLNSHIYYGYIIIRNKTGEVIGPSQIMHWKKLEEMAVVDDGIKNKLQHKSIAAAWFVSNCNALSGRGDFVKKVQKELDQYKLVIDIYGGCGKKKCSRGGMDDCLKKVERDYYFYLSFENSFSDDYVTEKLLHALNHYAVPVVYGTANYTRFMPDGIYLNALELGAKGLAKQMAEIITDRERYYEFFKWHNHYTYHYPEESSETDPHCKICKKVNDETVIKGVNRHEHLNSWWNPKKIRSKVCK